MARLRIFTFLLLLVLLGGLAAPVRAQTGIQVSGDKASLTFPDSVLFSAEFKSDANIETVVLEYGVDQQTCGTVEAKAFPQFTPAADVKAEWTWEMRQSGSLPPGASIWWQWQVKDANGVQFTSPRQTVTWIDNKHPWQVISGGSINLHYYDGGASFGQQLHDAAAQALVRLSTDVGLKPDKSVDIYIYANTNDLKDSILYEPSWVGGQAYPANDIVIIGVSSDQLDWGKSTEAHELTHVLVGHLTFSCLGFVPTWLNEGLAMYGEGGVQAAEQTQFDQAKTDDKLLSLRSLTGNFSEESDRATLSYTESYSVVNFLIKNYGRDKMTRLLKGLSAGQTADEALQAVYGFDTDGLEDAWRTSIGASPRAGAANPTPVLTPTAVPTLVPIGAAPVATVGIATPHPTPVEPTATATAAAPAEAPSQAGPTATLAPRGQAMSPAFKNILTVLEFGGACLLAVLLLVGIPIFTATRRRHGRKQ
ncbi:MAG TPA: peptidase MA family metallohydrolase [Anaerolineales bacterium]|nr:peptidase MA family metallohydrolase [Anaerolineales bacterium]